MLAGERITAEFYEAVANGRDPKMAANWIINELFGRLNKEGLEIDQSPISAAQLGAILDLLAEGVISGRMAKELFDIVWLEGGDPREIATRRGLRQVTDLAAIAAIVEQVIAANPDKAGQAKSKPALVGWFVGQVMKISGGQVNPQVVNALIKRRLGL